MTTPRGSVRSAAAAILAAGALLLSGCGGSAAPASAGGSTNAGSGSAGAGGGSASAGNSAGSVSAASEQSGGSSASGSSGNGSSPDASSPPASSAGQQGGSGTFGDLSKLSKLKPADVCALVPEKVAAAALGSPVVGTPDGMVGGGTNCIWESHKDMSGPEVTLQFGDPPVGSWKYADTIASVETGKKSLTIGGQDALEATDSDGNTECWVKLGGDDDTAMYVITPDAAGCEAVAAAALKSLAKGH